MPGSRFIVRCNPYNRLRHTRFLHASNGKHGGYLGGNKIKQVPSYIFLLNPGEFSPEATKNCWLYRSLSKHVERSMTHENAVALLRSYLRVIYRTLQLD